MSQSDDERTVHWYYRVGEKVEGPVLLSRLRQMARRGTLTADHLVRKGTAGVWVSAGNLAEIAAREAVPTGSLKSEEVTQEHLQPEVCKPSRLNELADALLESITGFISESVWAIVSRARLIRMVVGYLALSLVIVCLVRITVGPEFVGWSTPVDPYATCQTLWEELQQNRSTGADALRWQQFTQRGDSKLLPVVAKLEHEANSSNRQAQLLLWASRDCLPKMFRDARTETSSSERLFAEYLHNVDRLRKGESIYGSAAENLSRFPQSNRPWSWIIDDPVMALFGIVLTAANLTIAVWFMTRFFRTRLWIARADDRTALMRIVAGNQ